MQSSQNPRPFPAVDGINVQHRYVDVDGVKIHLAEAGSGEPLLMYHGWPQNWWMWRKQIPYFASRFRVIVPDMKGFGWSDATTSGYSKDQLADEFVRLIQVLGFNSVRLLSHD
jgi:pimeloyl-ACP methyl ester carboxylesterase